MTSVLQNQSGVQINVEKLSLIGVQYPSEKN